MHDFFILLKVFSRGYVRDNVFEQVCRIHATLLRKIDGAFSCLRQVDPNHERIRDSGDFVYSSMKTWRNIGISVTPKAHTFEDHTIESMQALNGMGDKTEYFIEFPIKMVQCLL